jgi:RNA polymerase sigma factor (sigma-70 family)
MTRSERDRLVTENLDLVEKIAGALLRHFPPSIELDDLKQQGAVGLMQAAERYSSGFQKKGFKTPVNFRQYAKCRVRGAILDANRRRHYREATHVSLSDQENTPPERNTHSASSHISTLLRADSEVDASIDRRRLAREVRNVVEMLPKRERAVVRRYYGSGQTEPQIAREAAVSPSLVSSIRKNAISSLKRNLVARGIGKVA